MSDEVSDQMEFVFRITINGGFYDYPTLKEALESIDRKWHEKTSDCSIRRIVENLRKDGCMKMAICRPGEKVGEDDN